MHQRHEPALFRPDQNAGTNKLQNLGTANQRSKIFMLVEKLISIL